MFYKGLSAKFLCIGVIDIHVQQRDIVEENSQWQYKTRDPGPNSAQGLHCHQPGVAALRGVERLQVSLPVWPGANFDLSFELSQCKEFQNPNCFPLRNIRRKKLLINKYEAISNDSMYELACKLLLLNVTVKAELPVIFQNSCFLVLLLSYWSIAHWICLFSLGAVTWSLLNIVGLDLNQSFGYVKGF